MSDLSVQIVLGPAELGERFSAYTARWAQASPGGRRLEGRVDQERLTMSVGGPFLWRGLPVFGGVSTSFVGRVSRDGVGSVIEGNFVRPLAVFLVSAIALLFGVSAFVGGAWEAAVSAQGTHIDAGALVGTAFGGLVIAVVSASVIVARRLMRQDRVLVLAFLDSLKDPVMGPGSIPAKWDS